MVSVGFSTWRGREDLKSILWEIPPACIHKYIHKPFTKACLSPTTTLLLRQGKEYSRARQGDKRYHYAADYIWVQLTALINFFALTECITEALLGFLCIRPYIHAIKKLPTPLPIDSLSSNMLLWDEGGRGRTANSQGRTTTTAPCLLLQFPVRACCTSHSIRICKMLAGQLRKQLQKEKSR